MARSTHTVWINCDAAELFGVLMDPAANRRWQTGVVETRANCNGAAAVGTTMHEVREVAGYRATIEYRLVELEWPRRAVVRVIDGPLRGSASYSCRAARGGTELTVSSDVTAQGRWRYLSRALAGLLSAELAVSCQRLKSMLEEPATTTYAAPSALRVMSPA